MFIEGVNFDEARTLKSDQLSRDYSIFGNKEIVCHGLNLSTTPGYFHLIHVIMFFITLLYKSPLVIVSKGKPVNFQMSQLLNDST